MQRLHNNSVIYRSLKNKKRKAIFSYRSQLYLNNFGHSQTLIHINKNKWLVGCSPKRRGRYNWSTGLAEVSYPKSKHKIKVINSCHKLVRITNLKSATNLPTSKRRKITRSEAAISPNRKTLLIATLDDYYRGNFAIYRFKTIKKALRRAKHKAKKTVNLGKIKPIKAFHINSFYGDKIDSVQGYALDNHGNIYISEELNTNNKSSHNIVKLTYNSKKIKRYRLVDSHWRAHRAELEGIELKGHSLYATVAFHAKNNIVLGNKIYRIKHI